MGKQHNLLTLPDLFQVRYQQPRASTIVAIIAVFALIPYVTLQLSALQIFSTVAGHGAIDPVARRMRCILLIIAFVFVTGLRGTAWASIIKDALVIGALIFVGMAIPHAVFRLAGGNVRSSLARASRTAGTRRPHRAQRLAVVRLDRVA